ncbi:MAG: choline ABC transporter ATP-binding protein [Defluviicoccus sp.]|nr:choline ABC transporter ATP-binding protein [Defluviicoccus sp.]
MELKDVDILFGGDTGAALRMLDGGGGRQEIHDATGAVVGVAGASLAVRPGEICVLMGLSGSGKSTLLRAVNGLCPVTRGRVLVRDGGEMLDMTLCDAATLRRMRMQHIAMVFQQFALLPWRTVHENVSFGLELRGTNRAERDALVAEKLKLVDLDRWADRFVHELSGGMQQRVGLARALATDSDILLMDEPFSALDPLIREHLQDELLDLQRRLGKTILFVSHDLNEALKLGRHIAIMEAGRIVQFGEPEEIVLSPANAYVAEFIAHMDALNVLRCGSLMTPVAEIRRGGGKLLLDWSGLNRLSLNEAGEPVEASIEPSPAAIRHHTPDMDPAALDGGTICAAAPDLRMRVAIELRHCTGRPVLMVDDGRLVGVIGDDEIYRGLMTQGAPAAR